MKLKELSILALCSSFASLHAGERYTTILDALELEPIKPQLCQQLGNALQLYNNKEASYINNVSLILRGQYQMAGISPAGTNHFRQGSGGHDDEWRRFYVGGRITMFSNKLLIHSMINVGELEGMHTERDGRWARTRRDWSIYELYAQYTENDISYSIGKIAPNITAEYSISSSDILTVERTTLVNQLDSDSNWGVVVSDARKDVPLSWNFGVQLNGTGTNLSDEIKFSTNDSVFVKGSLVWDTSNILWGEKNSARISYAHNFSHYDGRIAEADDFFRGPGARDIVSLSWTTKKGAFSLLAETAAGFGLENTNQGKNVYGFHMIPAYRISPHWEGVFRYQLAWGKNSVQSLGRYYPALTTYLARVDSLNAFYMGLNYYLCPENPALAKLMFGIEYTVTTVSQPDQKGFAGWTYMAAMRFKF